MQALTVDGNTGGGETFRSSTKDFNRCFLRDFSRRFVNDPQIRDIGIELYEFHQNNLNFSFFIYLIFFFVLPLGFFCVKSGTLLEKTTGEIFA